MIEGDEAGGDRRRRSDSCTFPHEGHAAQLGLELFASVAVETDFANTEKGSPWRMPHGCDARSFRSVKELLPSVVRDGGMLHSQLRL